MRKILASRIATVVTMGQYIDEIEVLSFGSSVLDPTGTRYSERCISILSPAWRADFTHVQMQHMTIEACRAKMHMHAQNGYVDACKVYNENNCGFHTIKITKQ